MADGELMPTLIADMPWRLVETQGVRMGNSGFSQALGMVEPYWEFEAATPWLKYDQFQDVEGFLLDRRGAMSTFTAYRQSRPYGKVPVSSDTGLTVTAWDRAASTLSFGSTGAWTANRGDPLSYYTEAGGYWLGVAMETKSASGGAMTALKVHPPPFQPHASTPAPRRIRALGEFFIVPPTPMPIERVDERRISFTARQIIRG